MDYVREYHTPGTVEEVLSLLQREGAILVAGGTDVAVKQGKKAEILVDITRVGLNEIRQDEEGIHIGAAATIFDLADSQTIALIADGILSDAAASFISRQIRHAATLGGNLAGSSPAADLPPALLALDAVVHIRREGESLDLSADDFFIGPGQNALEGGLLEGVTIPETADRRGAFLKVGRTSEDLAIVNAGVSLRLEGSICRDVRIALGSVGPTPMRVPDAESLLEEREPTATLLEVVAEKVREKVKPHDDHRAGAAYRRQVSGVLARRGLEICLRNGGVSPKEGD